MASYRLYAVRIFVSDWNRALEFYAKTLEMPVAFADEAMGWAELGIEGGHLALERVRPDDPESAEHTGRFLGVSLQVPSVAERYAELLARGVEFLAPPEKQPWGEFAVFKDPDGNQFVLSSP